jgi:hypothetical protein
LAAELAAAAAAAECTQPNKPASLRSYAQVGVWGRLSWYGQQTSNRALAVPLQLALCAVTLSAVRPVCPCIVQDSDAGGSFVVVIIPSAMWYI